MLFFQFIVTLVLHLEENMNLPRYQASNCVDKRCHCYLFCFSILVFPFIIGLPCLFRIYSYIENHTSNIIILLNNGMRTSNPDSGISWENLDLDSDQS